MGAYLTRGTRKGWSLQWSANGRTELSRWQEIPKWERIHICHRGARLFPGSPVEPLRVPPQHTRGRGDMTTAPDLPLPVTAAIPGQLQPGGAEATRAPLALVPALPDTIGEEIVDFDNA